MTRQALHLTLTETLRRQIRAGAFRPGERLPSIRQLRRQTHLSVTTVVRALQMLENEGLIKSRPRSGYVVRVEPGHVSPHPNRLYLPLTPSLIGLASKVHQFQREVTNPGLIPLGRAVPPPDVVPNKLLATIIRSVLREDPAQAFAYQVPPGNVLLREQLAKRSLAWGCRLQPNDFVITVGCTEAVRLALMAVARPGDTIAIESPTFFGTLQALSHLQLRALEIPSDPVMGIDLEYLKQALRRRRVAAIVTAPSFSNPNGSLLGQDDRKKLVELAEQVKVPVIEIDLLGDLHHGLTRPWAAKGHDKSGNVLLCGSFSKTVAPGLRVGWIAPGRYYDKVVAAQLSTTFATPSLLPAAMALFLKEGGYDRYLRSARELYRARVRATRTELRKLLPDGCEISSPEGGYLLWLTLPKSADSWNIYCEARRLGFSVAPGVLFSISGRTNHCLRINAGNALTPQIKEAIGKVTSLAV